MKDGDGDDSSEGGERRLKTEDGERAIGRSKQEGDGETGEERERRRKRKEGKDE